MKINLFSILFASANIVNAQLIPQFFTLDTADIIHEDTVMPKTFMDSLFGSLVNTPYSTKYKLKNLKSGKISEPLSVQSQNALGEYWEINKIKYPDPDSFDDFINPLYSGLVTFGHLPAASNPMACFTDEFDMDIAILGAPFDSGVSYSPGARFGPNGIRQGSRRLGGGISPIRGNSKSSKLVGLNPYNVLKVMDCGDVPMLPFDSRIALNQLYRGERAVHKHNTTDKSKNWKNTRIITLGGDHTVSLMNIRSAWETFVNGSGSVDSYAQEGLAVIHFDAHIDTWDPKVLGGGVTKYASLNHGTFLHYAHEAGYVSDHSVHVGIRAPYISSSDLQHDKDCGFETITSKDVDTLTPRGVGKKIKDIVGDRLVYITFDLDTFDPGMINSGTLEAGGLTSREVMTILDELEGLNIVGADVVEVSTPPNAMGNDVTGLLAAQVVDELLGLMVVSEL